MLKRKMEGLSKGILERLQEYGSFFIYNNNKNSIATASGGCYSGKNQRRMQEVAEVANQDQARFKICPLN